MTKGSFVLLSLTMLSCSPKENNTVHYIAVNKRDTARLELTLFDKTFFGKLKVFKPGNVVDSGDVQGNIRKDTLLGDVYYRPYGARNKIRRPFVLLKDGTSFIQGGGAESMYMGIPYYAEGTISFDSPKFVFRPDSMRL